MEIGALSSSLSASHIPQVKVADDAAARVRQAARSTTEVTRKQDGPSETARHINAEATRPEARETRDTQKTDTASSNSSPRIQFSDAEGTRVMEVYDSKNILIYQVPPKGMLTLIQSQESQPEPQVETSA